MKIIFEKRKCLLKKIYKEKVRKRYLINFYDVCDYDIII